MGRGDGRVFKRGASWWFQFQAQGSQHREPARVVDKDGTVRPARNETETVRAIQERRQKVRSEVNDDRYVRNAGRLTVTELLDDYVRAAEVAGLKSLRTVKVHLLPVRLFFKGWRALEVTSDAIDDYRDERLKDGRAPATASWSCSVPRSAPRPPAGRQSFRHTRRRRSRSSPRTCE